MALARLRMWVNLSIGAALLTIGLKTSAYLFTGSVGLLSDALESGVNLVAAITAYLSLSYAAKPVDANHTYGQEKIEFFSSGLEGVLIFIAGLGTMGVALRRLLYPAPLEELGLGTGLALLAALLNGIVGMLLVRVGKQERSIVLEADGKHLLTDVLTSVGVVFGLGIVWLTKLDFLDSLMALLVSAFILLTGYRLMRRSFDGLMDHALPLAELTTLRQAIKTHSPPNSDFHELRTRRAGARIFLEFHLLIPGDTTVRAGHDLVLQLERELHAVLPGLVITIHLEPIEDSASWEDNSLGGIEPKL